MTYKTLNPKAKIIGIRIDRGMEIKVEKYCRQRKISISKLIREFLRSL